MTLKIKSVEPEAQKTTGSPKRDDAGFSWKMCVYIRHLIERQATKKAIMEICLPLY